MKIAFLQDFFDNEIIGGAEKNDSVLLNHLNQLDMRVVPVHTYMIDHVIDCYDFFIVSNFVKLSQQAKSILMQKQNYIIYEHDHKYVANRNPAAFKDFAIPREKIINRDFYASAKKVFVLSNVCESVIKNNLEINNVHNIGCSLWTKAELEILKELSTTKKEHDYGILNSANTIKGTSRAAQYCESQNISPYLLRSDNYQTFLTQLASCKNLIFLPQVLETFSRVTAEAKMLNCKVLTTPKLIGFFSEEYSTLSGPTLVDKISGQIDQALVKFEEVIVQ